MTTTSRRRARRGSPPIPAAPAPSTDPSDVASTIVATVVFVVIGAFVLIPVVWALVHGYRWALR